mgnify:CR=1 FL=1
MRLKNQNLNNNFVFSKIDFKTFYELPFLSGQKSSILFQGGIAFGDVPLNLEYKLEVWDSPNSAGVIIDALRCAKLGLDRKVGGALLAPSSYFMKTPPIQYTDEQAHTAVEEFISAVLVR